MSNAQLQQVWAKLIIRPSIITRKNSDDYARNDAGKNDQLRGRLRGFFRTETIYAKN